ncbi:MAG: hypothetical protein Q4Q03_04365, partial [Bowdeniella nasicola]|nr:hypothetical protein [Bowdeniella nasicola]
IILAWALIIAAGIYLRAGRSPRQATIFTIVVIGVPFIVALASPSAKVLIVADWRSYIWLAGHVLAAIITRIFGAATSAPQEQSPTTPGVPLAVSQRNGGNHVHR